METPEEMCRFIEDHIRKSLKGFIGAPPNIEAIKSEILAKLQEISAGELVDYESLIKVLVIPWLPLEERQKLDIKSIVKGISTSTLQWVVDRTGAVGIGSILYVELMFRRGELDSDWNLEFDGNNINLIFNLKCDVKYIKMDFTIEKSTSNEFQNFQC